MQLLVPVKREKLSRREKFERDCQAFVEEWCADHEAFVTDPAAYYRAQLPRKNPGAARGFSDDGSQARYYSPYEEESRFRSHEAVGGYRCGGFGNDGVAIRAKQGYTGTANEQTGAEGFQFISGSRATYKPNLPQASMPGPVKIGARWEYCDDGFFVFVKYAALFKPTTNRGTRIVAASGPLTPLIHWTSAKSQTGRGGMHTAVGLMEKERRKAQAKSEQTHRHSTSTGLLALSACEHPQRCKKLALEDRCENCRALCLALGFAPTEEEIRHWKRTHWARRWNGTFWATGRKVDCREGRLEPWCVCEVCLRWYPNLERADWRTVWCEETGEDLSTRKIRDLNTRLKLYRYGDHNLQPEKMRRVTAKRLQDAFTAIPFTPRFFWPENDLRPSIEYTESARAGLLSEPRASGPEKLLQFWPMRFMDRRPRRCNLHKIPAPEESRVRCRHGIFFAADHNVCALCGEDAKTSAPIPDSLRFYDLKVWKQASREEALTALDIGASVLWNPSPNVAALIREIGF